MSTTQHSSIEEVGAQLPPTQKYRPFAPVHLPDRTWPDKQITRAPIWCSVDLRDGNQALAIPMSVEEKLEMFQLLVEIGFKEIEIGFPSASQIEFDFCRRLIDENRIPDDVSVQVLVQAREELIRRSFEALQGAKRAIVHLYNSTNPAQRKIVFGMSKEEIQEIAVRGASLIRGLADQNPQTHWVMEYSPESFVLTELEFSLQICEAVAAVWKPTPDNKIILNLPTTVESSTPNVHADQIEWFGRHLSNRDSAIISLHTHNDRGTGIASTELALLAGAQRVEGTLFGNGERTGNLDIVTVALNLFSQGVDPKLDFSDLPRVREVYERTTRMEVPPRAPYAGDLTFTAFSGSHQDAINKGFAAQDPNGAWEVPYLPIDPKDIGRTYEKIVRYNPQSGKGGLAFLLEQNYGFDLPKAMRVEFGKIMNAYADKLGREIAAEEIYNEFRREYLENRTPLSLDTFRSQEDESLTQISAKIRRDNEILELKGRGNGPIDAFVSALQNVGIGDFAFKSYAEHSLGSGAGSQAAAYVA
ncbi:MAG: 2-isopropylmalate synthase, partial [Armatimonadetes bacterium]|nr:2-isopropylmalate synthase [Armatimonadota bacterium]